MADVKVISDTIQEFNGERYYLCGYYFQHKGKRLHRAVWEYYNGEIPEGYHVHHIDEDRGNNQIENLSLVPGVEHINHHAQSEKWRENGRRAIVLAIEAAPEWHASEEGFEWHSRQAKMFWNEREPHFNVCNYCGDEYLTRCVQIGGKHFCSNKCKAAARRAAGVDNEERVCPVCGGTFIVNKYSKTECCGSECARNKRWGK